MGVEFHKVKVKKIDNLTPDVIEMTIDKPEGKHFKPGQFATIKVEDGQPGVCMRSYSVLSGNDTELQLCIKKVEGGRGTGFLFSREVGDEMEMMYPLGHFGLPEKLADKLVFIGTGTGLVPLLCMLESLPVDLQSEVKLIFGVRYAKDLFYVDRIEALAQKLPNFKSVITISRPEDGWAGEKGRVTEHLEGVDPTGQYFMCGSGAMIKEVRELLVSKGVPKENVMFENFGG